MSVKAGACIDESLLRPDRYECCHSGRNNRERAEKGLEPSNQLPPVYTLGAAAFSKFVATTSTYPHEVVRTR